MPLQTAPPPSSFVFGRYLNKIFVSFFYVCGEITAPLEMINKRLCAIKEHVLDFKEMTKKCRFIIIAEVLNLVG